MATKRQLWRVRDCKVVVGEHVTTQHEPVVFVKQMKKITPVGGWVTVISIIPQVLNVQL